MRLAAEQRAGISSGLKTNKMINRVVLLAALVVSSCGNKPTPPAPPPIDWPIKPKQVGIIGEGRNEVYAWEEPDGTRCRAITRYNAFALSCDWGRK